MKFNIGKFLLGVGKGLIKEVPGAETALSIINSFMPDDEKLSLDSTGNQVLNAVNSLPPDQKASLLEKKIDLEIAESNNWAAVQGSLADADKTGNSTRPGIAKMMAYLVVYADGLFITLICYAVGANNTVMIGQLKDLWLVIAAVLGTPTALLIAYFGMRTREKQFRYQAATGQPQPTNILANIIGTIGAFRKG